MEWLIAGIIGFILGLGTMTGINAVTPPKVLQQTVNNYTTQESRQETISTSMNGNVNLNIVGNKEYTNIMINIKSITNMSVSFQTNSNTISTTNLLK